MECHSSSFDLCQECNIFCFDFFFRVEMLKEAEDKAKGGKDFQAVVKVTIIG